MEADSEWGEDFVLEMDKSMELHSDSVDENDNYKCQTINIERLPVDPARSNLAAGIDKKLGGNVEIKSEIKRESDTQKQTAARKRQTTLSEYFAVIPPEAPVKLAPDDTSEKMVNVSLLLSQLLTAQVVINRLPDYKIVKSEPSTIYRKSYVHRYCHSCETLNVDHTNLMMQKSCSKCGTMLLYVCDKCNEKRYRTYKCVKRHSVRCTGKKIEKPAKIPSAPVPKPRKIPKIRQPLGKFRCEYCSFRTDYSGNLNRHLSKCHVE